MNFKLEESLPDLATALREVEPQAPKQIKPLLIEAAQKLEAHQALFGDAAAQLAKAATLRIGQMDSQSRADEIWKLMRTVMTEVELKLRAQMT